MPIIFIKWLDEGKHEGIIDRVDTRFVVDKHDLGDILPGYLLMYLCFLIDRVCFTTADIKSSPVSFG